jgi:hypothetical protein
VRPKCLLHVVNELHVSRIEEVLYVKEGLYALDTNIGERRLLGLQVDLEILLALKVRNYLIDDEILIGRLFSGPGDNQWRSGLINKNGVYLVHDREVVPALDHLSSGELHVVTEIVESELVVLSVRNIGLIRGATRLLTNTVVHATNREPKEGMNAAHPLSVTSSKVIVHRYNVYTFPRKRVQVGRKGSYESFTLSGSHLGDHLIVKDRTADKLNIEMAHANNAPTRLSNNGERVRKKTVKRLAEIYPLLKASGLITKVGV